MTDPTSPQETPVKSLEESNARVLDRMREITEMIERLQGERTGLGRALPPVRYADLVRDGNFLDRSFERDVEEFMQRMSPIDVTLLDREDPDKWELLTPRYELRETSIETRDSDEMEEVWAVFDHDEGRFITGEDEDGEETTLYFAFESLAEDACSDLNAEDEQNRCGFPFAWNTGWVVEDGVWLAELRAAGFLVYRYDTDLVVAGIDGGGYAFKGAHFSPFYASLAHKNGWMVRTNAGPRYLTTK